MYSINTSSTRQLPISATDVPSSANPDGDLASLALLERHPVRPREDKQVVNSVRRKPSPLWPQHEWASEGSATVVLGAPIHSAGLSSGSTTDSEASMFIATPKTPVDSSHFSADPSPKPAQNQQYFLPVDLLPQSHEKEGPVNPTGNVIRIRPAISTRTSSVQTEVFRTVSNDQSLKESKDLQKSHYVRAARPSPTILTPDAPNSPGEATSLARPSGSSRTGESFTDGLRIQGIFEPDGKDGGLRRMESKALPPIPLSRSTTGVAGGPAPLPTSTSTDTAWKTYQPKKVKQEFSVDKLVDPIKLWEASHCYVTDELGRKRRFGEFFDVSPESQAPAGRHPPSRSSSRSGLSRYSSIADSIGSRSRKSCGGENWNVPGRKTVVFYIRHFWCGQCQDFTFASLSLLDPEAINAAGINVIVISNGSWRIIKRYRELFKCPYPIYVDEQRHLYEKMGMVLLNNDFGPMFKGRAAYNQRSAPSQLVHGLKRAFVDMPIANPGKLTQLGGEFIVGPGLQCHFAHRMTNTSNHMEAFDVLQLAGCEKPTTDEQRIQRFAAEELAEIEQLQREEQEWRENRVEEIDRIQRSRAARRQHLSATEQQQLETSIRRLSIPMETQEDQPVNGEELSASHQLAEVTLQPISEVERPVLDVDHVGN